MYKLESSGDLYFNFSLQRKSVNAERRLSDVPSWMKLLQNSDRPRLMLKRGRNGKEKQGDLKSLTSLESLFLLLFARS